MYEIKFNYENKKLPVDVIYRNRKSVTIKVMPKDKIQIIAPNKVSKEANIPLFHLGDKNVILP